jgi:hypothetical protein
MQNFLLIPNMMFISFQTEALIMKISEYELIFMVFWHYMALYDKKITFFNNEIIFSKTHAYFFWHIYKGYNYDKRINKTCIYGKLMSLEGTPSEGHIPIYRLSHGSASCSKIILLISVKSFFLHRALSHTLIKILGEHKIKIKCTKNINILSYFTDNVWI